MIMYYMYDFIVNKIYYKVEVEGVEVKNGSYSPQEFNKIKHLYELVEMDTANMI